MWSQDSLRTLRFASAVAFVGAMSVASHVAFADPDSAPAPPTGNRVSNLVLGLRQSLSDTDLAHAVNEAAKWVAQLEVSSGNAQSGANVLGFETKLHAAPLAPIVRALWGDSESSGSGNPLHPSKQTALSYLAQGTLSNERSWVLAHAQANLGAEMGSSAIDPAAYLAGITNIPNTGSALAEHSLTGHEIEFSLPMPALPWAKLTAGYYWSGDRNFNQQISGNRVGASVALTDHLNFDGGRSYDQVRGEAGFLGFHYRLPLDTEKPPGVMP
jgi:hypothetical protein